MDETIEGVALHLGENHNGKHQSTVHQAHQPCFPSAGPQFVNISSWASAVCLEQVTRNISFCIPVSKKPLTPLQLAASCPDVYSKYLLLPISFWNGFMAQSRGNKHNADSICANQNGTAANGLIIILQPFASFYLSDALYTLSMEIKDCR